jgi:hypothetical protein
MTEVLMPQATSQAVPQDSFVAVSEKETSSTATDAFYSNTNSAESSEQLESVMGELNRLSKS